MKVVLKLVVFCVSILFSVLKINAQDPYFSQFYASRVFLNPAYAGFDEGTTVELSYRDQWFGVPDGDVTSFKDSYRTFLADVNIQFPCLFDRDNLRSGLGFMAIRDEAGNNPLTTHSFGIANSLSIDINYRTGKKTTRSTLKAGLQTNLLQKQLDGDFFIYSSQLDPVWGLLEDAISQRLQSSMFLNLNAGILFRHFTKEGNAKTGKLLTVGLSVFNTAEPNESILEGAGSFSLYRRHTIHGSYTFPLGARSPFVKKYLPVSISTQFRFDTQAEGSLNMLTLGGYALSKGFYFGCFYQGNLKRYDSNVSLINPYSQNFLTQNTTNLILSLGFDVINLGNRRPGSYSGMQRLVIGLSYDIGIQGLTQQNTAGVLELQISCNFGSRLEGSCRNRPGSGMLYNGECPINY